MLSGLRKLRVRLIYTEWSKWFKSCYILARYEDVISNMSKLVNDTYKFIGLDMIETINNWIKGVPPPVRSHNHGMVISNADATRIDNWRFRENSSRVSLFEEACEPRMEAMGYVFINGSENLQHNNSKPLRTPNIPFVRDLQ